MSGGDAHRTGSSLGRRASTEVAEVAARLRPFVARRVREPADVDDVLQETLLRLQRGAHALRDDERFGPWVRAVARSAIADHRRARARHPLPASAPHEPEGDAGYGPGGARATDPDADADGAERELAQYVSWFVSMLPSPYREALTLTELEGLTHREAAATVGASLAAMKARVLRGRKLLRQSPEE